MHLRGLQCFSCRRTRSTRVQLLWSETLQTTSRMNVGLLILSCFALQTRSCSSAPLARIGMADISDLQLVVSSEHSTGQACLVTSDSVESSLFCTGLSWVSLSSRYQRGERRLEKNDQGETFWVIPHQGTVWFDRCPFLQSLLEKFIFTTLLFPWLKAF